MKINKNKGHNEHEEKRTDIHTTNKEHGDSKKYDKKGYHIQRIKPTDAEKDKGRKI